jgi:hypothetical protein
MSDQMMSPAEARQWRQGAIAKREQAQADAAAGSSWLQHGLDRLAEAERPAADPQLVHLQKDPGHYEDPRKVAWSLYSAAQTEDPAVAEFKRSRADAGIKDMPWGQSGFNDNLRGSRPAGRQ